MNVPEMWMAKLMRCIRSRTSLIILLIMGLIYVSSVILWSFELDSESDVDYGPKRTHKEIQWEPNEDSNVTSSVIACRNSVQGKLLIADDRGYVCKRTDLLSTGCCNPEEGKTSRYSCSSCNKNGCCAVFEHCVSCCLHPNKTRFLKHMLSQILNASPVFGSVSDRFELCLVKCRTSSNSVLHETHYKNPSAKYCYSDERIALKSSGS